MANLERANIPLQISQNCVVASIQAELTPAVLEQLRQDILNKLHDSGADGVIIDLSGIEILDLTDFNELRQIIDMVGIMGAKTIMSGFKPELISALVDLDANIDGINAAFNLDDAFIQLKKKS